MEQNLPIVAKKFWSTVRALYVMLRKGISKHRLVSDLSAFLKRGKIAGKLAALNNFLFHHHHHGHSRRRLPVPPPPPEDYEFSCSNTPAHFPYFIQHLKARGNHAPPLDFGLMADALEIFHSATASPALPGFGPSPAVRQLRISDSPFPLRGGDGDDHVDEAAEEFISRFYRDLERQSS
ncbi:hypothetical protein M569_05009, partial [Genlisea aurea]